MATIDLEDVPLTGPKARRLADMAGVHLDLRWTAGACAQLIRRKEKLRIDEMCIDAIHDAALIRYARCFKKGRRNAFQIPDEWLKNLPEPLRRSHNNALDLRDKHIAHSVNDWEINVPVAQVATDRGSRASTVRSVSIRQMRVLMMGTDSLQKLHNVAKALADRVLAAMAELQREVLQEARRVPPSELRRRAPRTFPAPARRKVSVDRRRK